jgi:hypothetical protein
MSKLPRLPAGPRAPRLGPLRRYRPQPVPLPRLSPPEDSGGRTWPSPPRLWQGGPALWQMYWAHGPLGRGQEGVRWYYQRPLFGNIEITGFIPDFIEADISISIDVVRPDSNQTTRLLRKILMASHQYIHVVVSERSAMANPLAALREALAGQDVGVD